LQERIQGNSKNLTGRTKAHIIGHGTEENGIRKLKPFLKKFTGFCVSL
jgi:hypothetical protein